MASFPSGIAYPFRFNSNGSVQRSEGGTKLGDNLKAIVKTALNERVRRPSVGMIGYQQVFRNTNEKDLAWITGIVKDAIYKNEPRVVVRYVVLEKIDKELYIKIAVVAKTSAESIDVLVQL
jgi:phage baseplate assembly protein W